MSNQNKQFYVYTHARPNTNDVHGIFYVGKGNNKRIGSVLRNNQGHKNFIKKYGKENIIVRKLVCESEQYALNLEVQMIAKLREIGVDLVNNTDGGDGVSGLIHSKETRKKISDRGIGRIISEETRKKLIESHSGIKNGFFGKSHTEETKRKISDKKTGFTYSNDVKAKVGLAVKKNWEKTEYRENQVALRKKIWSNPTYRENVIKKLRENGASDEFKAKMSEVNKANWIKRKAKKLLLDSTVQVQS